jgi:hypothetical protein
MTLNDKLEAHFKAHPGEWQDGKRLAEIAGYGGWRNRITDLRLIRKLDIENRRYRVTRSDGSSYTKSEYVYRPASLLEMADAS